MKLNLPDELKFISNSRLPQKQTTESMNGKTVVITGSTSGVGYHATLRMAKAGAKIIMIVRNKEKAEALCREIETLSEHPADYFIADFADLAQVRKATQQILDKYPKIDVLVNNAGVHITTRKLTKNGNEMAFGVNHLSAFLITALMLKRLIQSAPSRIIQVNSEGHRFNGLKIDDLTWQNRKYRGLKGYGASKTAQLMTVWELTDLLKNTGVTINAMHPGAVKSNIGHNNGKLYNLYSKYLIQPLLKKTEISGEAIYYLAAAPEMANVSGKFYNLTNLEIPAKHALDRTLGKKIYDLSIELVQIDKEKHLNF